MNMLRNVYLEVNLCSLNVQKLKSTQGIHARNHKSSSAPFYNKCVHARTFMAGGLSSLINALDLRCAAACMANPSAVLRISIKRSPSFEFCKNEYAAAILTRGSFHTLHNCCVNGGHGRGEAARHSSCCREPSNVRNRHASCNTPFLRNNIFSSLFLTKTKKMLCFILIKIFVSCLLNSFLMLNIELKNSQILAFPLKKLKYLVAHKLKLNIEEPFLWRCLVILDRTYAKNQFSFHLNFYLILMHIISIVQASARNCFKRNSGLCRCHLKTKIKKNAKN